MSDLMIKLEEKIAKASSTREKIDALNDLAWEMGYQDIARAIQLSEEALTLSRGKDEKGNTYLRGEARSLLILGRMNTELGNFPESTRFLMQARPLFEDLDDQPGLMHLMNEFGRVSYYLTDYSTALQYYLQELTLAQKLGDRERENATAYNIALIHLYSDNYRMAIKDFERTVRVAEEMNDLRMQSFVHIGLSEVYLRQGEAEKSLEHAHKSEQAALKANFTGTKNNYMLSLGDASLALDKLDDAETYYTAAIDAAILTGSRYDKAYTTAAIAKLQKKRNNLAKALELFNQAQQEAEEIGARDLVFASHQSISEVYEMMGDFKKALEHYKSFYSTEKALFNEKSDMKLRTLEVMHQVETSRRESEIYQLKNALLQQEIEERKKVQAVLEELVNIEPLTGLFNRRHFFDEADKEFSRGKRYHHAFSVIMADIDHFKEINDRFGHAVGDQALITIAGLIRRNLRAADIVCRYGGEEFAFLLPETTGELALQVAERIRAEVAAYPFEAEGKPFQVTVSMGVVQCPDHCNTLDELFLQADRTLYDAKRQGRNQTLLFDSD